MSGIPSWARVGAKVVCVDAGPGDVRTGTQRLVAGEIYTLSEVTDEFRVPACKIAEHGYGRDEYCRLDRFRPLITQQDDLANHFKALLDVPEQVLSLIHI